MKQGKQEHIHSAFAGHSMERIAVASPPHLSALASLGIFDAEQLMGMVAAMGGTKEIAAATGLSDADITGILQKTKTALPSTVVTMNAEPHHIRYGLGAMLEHNAKTRADIEAHLRQRPSMAMGDPAVLPDSVNHIPQMNPVQDQGARGTCVGFGATAMHEHLRGAQQPQAKTKFSEEFLYHQTKTLDGYPDDCGTWLFYAVKAMGDMGQCPWSMLPYDPNPPCNHADTITPEMMKSAAMSKAQVTYFKDPCDVNAFKTGLAGGCCTAFCIPVFNSWYQSPSVAGNGQITMPLPDEKPVGGHCMCLVGYQNKAQYPGGGYFILRNSWGTGWASKNPYGAGYGTIPYGYIAKYCSEGASF